LNFGTAKSRPLTDENLRRESNNLYNLTFEHELHPGLGVSVGYNHRSFHNLQWTNNLATTFADYTLLSIPDPRGNGESLPVYNLASAKVGQVNNILTNGDNRQNYSGFDVLVHARTGRGAVISGGTSTGRTSLVTCTVSNPNSLRFCDQTHYGIPFLTAFKMS